MRREACWQQGERAHREEPRASQKSWAYLSFGTLGDQLDTLFAQAFGDDQRDA
jgi:hypothetical protein